MNHKTRIGSVLRRSAAALPALLLLAFNGAPALAESKSFVVDWFTVAADSKEGDCPEGENPNMDEEYAQELVNLGMTPAEAKTFIAADKFQAPFYDNVKLIETLANRGRIDGKPVNAYANPEAVIDPKLHTIGGAGGMYAYGFNLDGKGAGERGQFEDPETHEKGVDNQLYRALGCLHAFRGTKENRPTWPQWVWTMMKDSQPAWIITVVGADLSKDGDVKIVFDRALEHVTTYFDGNARPDMAFRIDPDPRSHNEFRGQIKDGTISIAQPGDFRMLMNQLYEPEISFYETHLRLKIQPNGNLDGFIGGYQPWLQVYWPLAQGGFGPERTLGISAPGVYHVMKQLADARPDAKTGQNTAISATYRIEAVPAFAAPGASAGSYQAAEAGRGAGNGAR